MGTLGLRTMALDKSINVFACFGARPGATQGQLLALYSGITSARAWETVRDARDRIWLSRPSYPFSARSPRELGKQRHTEWWGKTAEFPEKGGLSASCVSRSSLRIMDDDGAGAKACSPSPLPPPQCSQDALFLVLLLFRDQVRLCSELTPDSMLRNHS